MNKVGRRRVEARMLATAVSHEFMAAAPDASEFVQAVIDRDMSDRVTFGRWIAWRPTGERTIKSGRTGMDFVMNVTTVLARQPWEWRFIGRRRR